MIKCMLCMSVGTNDMDTQWHEREVELAAIPRAGDSIEIAPYWDDAEVKGVSFKLNGEIWVELEDYLVDESKLEMILGLLEIGGWANDG